MKSSNGWSSISPWIACNRQWVYRRDDVTQLSTPAMQLGTDVHKGLEDYYLGKDVSVGDKALSIVRQYQLHYPKSKEPWKEIVSVETEYFAELWPGLKPFSGRMDLIIRMANGKIYIVDHKTTSARDLQAEVTKFSSSGQMIGYHILGETAFGKEFGGILANMIGHVPSVKFHREFVKPPSERMKAFWKKEVGAAFEAASKATTPAEATPRMHELVCKYCSYQERCYREK